MLTTVDTSPSDSNNFVCLSSTAKDVFRKTFSAKTYIDIYKRLCLFFFSSKDRLAHPACEFQTCEQYISVPVRWQPISVTVRLEFACFACRKRLFSGVFAKTRCFLLKPAYVVPQIYIEPKKDSIICFVRKEKSLHFIWYFIYSFVVSVVQPLNIL